MTTKSTGERPWTAREYGLAMPKFTVNLIVRDVARSVVFYRDVMGATVRHADTDFAALQLAGLDFTLHADHTYDHHALGQRIPSAGLRGAGAELRLLGVDPDAVEARAREQGAPVIQNAGDTAHGWRDVIVADPDGYVWAVGILIPKLK
jgi:catechol 2,3-dioxygenase-like lactoylglutathione lyase family enzyme